MVVEPVIDTPIVADWDKVDLAIHKIHDILYKSELTLLEIDLIVYTVWTNTQKEKVIQLAMNDVRDILAKESDTVPQKPKESRAPGVQ